MRAIENMTNRVRPKPGENLRAKDAKKVRHMR